jgi:hypothetical protein
VHLSGSNSIGLLQAILFGFVSIEKGLFHLFLFGVPVSALLGLTISHNLRVMEDKASHERKGRGFITNLYSMFNQYLDKYSDFIEWANDGKIIVFRDPEGFARNVIPLFFKSSKHASFVRQLNMYCFKKVHNEALKTQGGPTPDAFYHPNFRKGREDLIHLIKRKEQQSPALKAAAAPIGAEVESKKKAIGKNLTLAQIQEMEEYAQNDFTNLNNEDTEMVTEKYYDNEKIDPVLNPKPSSENGNIYASNMIQTVSGTKILNPFTSSITMNSTFLPLNEKHAEIVKTTDEALCDLVQVQTLRYQIEEKIREYEHHLKELRALLDISMKDKNQMTQRLEKAMVNIKNYYTSSSSSEKKKEGEGKVENYVTCIDTDTFNSSCAFLQIDNPLTGASDTNSGSVISKLKKTDSSAQFIQGKSLLKSLPSFSPYFATTESEDGSENGLPATPTSPDLVDRQKRKDLRSTSSNNLVLLPKRDSSRRMKQEVANRKQPILPKPNIPEQVIKKQRLSRSGLATSMGSVREKQDDDAYKALPVVEERTVKSLDKVEETLSMLIADSPKI